MPDFLCLDDLDLAGKRTLVRVDLNVPIRDGRVTDTTRLDRILPTVETLVSANARVILLAHFGRPKGKVVAEMSLAPIVPALEAALGRSVAFAADCIGPAASAAVEALGDGDVLLLENVRFHAGEEANDPEFARALAALGDAYVNDAFSAAHRAHATTEALARLLPAAAGRLMEAELVALGRALDSPARPVGAVVGGAKVSTKLDVLGHLVDRVDCLIVGGGMANTFLHAQGIDVGRSLCEHEMADAARAILSKAEAAGCRMLLPVDAVVAGAFEAGAPSETVPVDAVPGDRMILDVGPNTTAALEAAVDDLKTLVWNGPLGAFEVPPFDTATVRLARHAAARTDTGALLTVAGGGDTVAALAHAGVVDRFSYVSTAGGAFLEWLEGKDLPGVAALKAAKARG